MRPLQFAPQRVVERINPLPRRVRLQTREDGLQTEVILLVDHRAERLIRIEEHAALALAFGQRRANQVALHQQLALIGL